MSDDAHPMAGKVRELLGFSQGDAAELATEVARLRNSGKAAVRFWFDAERRAEAAESALDAARAQGRADGLWMAAARVSSGEGLPEIGKIDRNRYVDAILALIPAPAKPADGPRRASGPIDPENGFATAGAETRWIAATEAGIYDDDTGDIGRSIANTLAPPAPREGGEG